MSNDPIENALNWLEQGHKVAIATVVKTWGSAPRKAGSQLAIRDAVSYTHLTLPTTTYV